MFSDRGLRSQHGEVKLLSVSWHVGLWTVPGKYMISETNMIHERTLQEKLLIMTLYWWYRIFLAGCDALLQDSAGHYFQLSVVVVIRIRKAKIGPNQQSHSHFQYISIEKFGKSGSPSWRSGPRGVIMDFHIHLVVGPSSPISWTWLLMKHLKPQSRGV